MDARASSDDVPAASDDDVSIISVTMSEAPLLFADEDGGMTDVQSVLSTTTEPQTSSGREMEDMAGGKRSRVLEQ